MKIYAKLVKVQNELKAPKGQYNSFGKYAYRNQEDILEAVKPLLLKHNLTLFIKDEIELIGERYYIKATCVLIDTETGETVENSALARESVTKKGMDDSQITGSTSSYARKYALNGLFLIDDTKDADTDEFTSRTKPKATSTKEQEPKASEKQLNFMKLKIKEYCTKENKDEAQFTTYMLKRFELSKIEDATKSQASKIIEALTK